MRQLSADFLTACSTYCLNIVQVDENVAAHAVCYVLQYVHVFELRRAVALRRRWVVRVVDHVILVVVAIAVEVQALQLLFSLGRRGLEVFEEVNEGSCGCSARVCVFCAVFTHLPALRS